MTQKSTLPSLVFFGTPDFAVSSLSALVAAKFPILAVVTAADKPAGRGKKLKMSAVKQYALSQGLPVLQPEKLKNPEFLAELKALNAAVHIVVAFRMLPEAVWDMPPMGTINVHGSLLPQYRGAAPINHAIMNGETETGVTTFKLKHEIDTGDLLMQKKVSIAANDSFDVVYNNLMCAGAELLVETLYQLIEGKMQAIPQVIQGMTHAAPKIFREDCQINWQQGAKKIHDFIRGLSPIPTAFTIIEEKKFKILKANYETLNNNELQKPGSIKTDNKSYLQIAADDGWLNILILQPEGKKAMGIQNFLNGHKF